MTADITIDRINATDTHDLRRRVLRDGATDAVVEWDGDHETTTFHLGAFDTGGCLLAISTWLTRPDPLDPQRHAVQLRGMATEPTAVGLGVGLALVHAGCAQADRDGAVRVWADARVSALGFYLRAGFVITGPVFATAATGLPHRHVHIDIG